MGDVYKRYEVALEQNSTVIFPDSNDGEREQAALATVFGVQEYTESNMFWERLVQSKHISTKPKTTTHSGSLHFSSTSVPNSTAFEVLAKQPIQTITNPVKKVSDSLTQDEHDDVLFPANPSSVLLRPTSPICVTDEELSSVNTYTSSGKPCQEVMTEHPCGDPNLQAQVFFEHSPSIFDYLESDDDERIILWTREVPRPSKKQHAVEDPCTKIPERPVTLQGFSSNATASVTSNRARPARIIHSARLSAQSLFTDSINRLGRQKHLSLKTQSSFLTAVSNHQDDNAANNRTAQQTQKRTHFMHRISADTDSPQPPSDELSIKQIKAASVPKLVQKLTNGLDYALMTDFFLTYRTFISSSELGKLLVLRFQWALDNDDDEHRVVRVRTFVVIRHWLLNYFFHDFVRCRELRVILTTFLNSLPQHPLVQQSPRDQRIVRCLKRVFKQLKKVYYCGDENGINSNHGGIISNGMPSTGPNVQQSSYISDNDGSFDSDLSPGDTEMLNGIDLHPYSTNEEYWNEDHAMTQLEYERRRREDEEERQRIAFFTSGETGTSPPPSPEPVPSPPVRMQPQMCSGTPQTVAPLKALDHNIYTGVMAGHSTSFKRPPLPEAFLNGDPPSAEAISTKIKHRTAISATVIDDTTPQHNRDSHTMKTTSKHRSTSNANDIPPPTTTMNATVAENKPLRRSSSESLKPDTESVVKLLSRRLSRKSIKHQTSEKSIGISSFSMTSSLVSSFSAPLSPPPLVKTLNSGFTAEPLSEHHSIVHQNDCTEFEAVPYDTTHSAGLPSLTPPSSRKGNKKGFPKRLANMFNPQIRLVKDEQKQNESSIRSTLERSTSPQTASSASHPLPKEPDKAEAPQLNLVPTEGHQTESVDTGGQPMTSTMLSRIAAELRQEDLEEFCPDARCQSEEDILAEPKLRRPRHGPIYLSHLVHAESDAAMNIIEDNGDGKTMVIDDINEGNHYSWRLSRQLSITSNATTQPTNGRPTSLIVETDGQASLMQLLSQINQEQSTAFMPTGTCQKEGVSPTEDQHQHQHMYSVPAYSFDQMTERSFILDHHPEELAQQFCLIEREMLLNVDWEDLIDCRWLDRPPMFCGVQRLIQRFNSVCQWVASEIVTTKSPDERARVIERFIHLAQNCKLKANFATLVQILLGLQSPVISRLQRTWVLVKQSDLCVLDELSEFTSPMKNWKHIRDTMNKVAIKYGDSSHANPEEGTGCIPFIGIYLSDLIFNAELPSYLPPPKQACDLPLLQQPLVNFQKCRTTAIIIKRILTFQNLARHYHFAPNPELFVRCLRLSSIDIDMQRQLSHALE